jgi:hypothetical protein
MRDWHLTGPAPDPRTLSRMCRDAMQSEGMTEDELSRHELPRPYWWNMSW